jgi:hypothetical protein
MRIAILILLGVTGISNPNAEARGRVLIMTDQWPILAIPCRHTMELMTQKGYGVCSKGDWNNITLDFLNKFDVVILGSQWPRVGDDGHVNPKIRQCFVAIDQYLRTGGAVFIAHGGDQDMGKGIAAQNQLLRPLDASVLPEMVDDSDSSHIYSVNPSAVYYRIFHSSQVLPSPVSVGVRGLNNVSYGAAAGSTLQNPIRVGSDWTVVVRGERSAFSKQLSGAAGTHAQYPPLVAIRQYGCGRMALWPVNAGFIYLDGYHHALDNGVVMNKAFNGMTSSGETLFYNILDWLSQTSHPARVNLTDADQALLVQPIADPTQKNYGWDTVNLARKPYPNIYKGLIGAVSNLSSGAATPQQMIDAAKAARYSFIVFTERLEQMTSAKWDSLNRACSANTDSTFLACPGLHFLDDQGGEYIIYNTTLAWPKAEWFCANQPGRLKWSGDMVYAGFSSGFCNWPACAVVKNNLNTASPKRAKPAMFLGHYKGFGVYTYENGRLVDDSYDTYLRLQENSYDVYPLAVHFVKNASEVADAAGPSYQTYVWGNSIGDVIANQCGIWGYAVSWWTFISNGPMIDNFIGANMTGADMADFEKDPDRLRLRIEVSSSRGLREVKLLDGRRLAVQWLPVRSTSLTKEIDRFHDRQHYYVLEITDIDGKKAISADRWSYIEDYSNGMCRDNWNTAQQGKAFENTIKPINGFENGIPQNGAEVMPCITASEAETAYRPAIYQLLRSSGRFGSTMDFILYGGYAAGTPRAFHGQHYPYTINPVDEYGFTLTKREFMQRPNHPFIHYYEGRIDIHALTHLKRGKDNWLTPSTGYPPIRLYASYPTQPTAGKIAYTSAGVMSMCDMVQGVEREAALTRGDYVTLYPSSCGSLTVIPLADGMKFYAATDQSGRPFVTLGINPANAILKPGASFDFKFVTVRGPVALEDQLAATAQSVVSAFGFRGNTAYKITPTVGSMRDGFPVNLQTTNGGFRGTINQVDLAIELPVNVHGLNDRIDGGIWYVGKCAFAVPQRTYDTIVSYKTAMVRKTATDLIARIPILDGVSACQIDTTYGTKDFFIGNFARCENPNVFVMFPQLRKDYAKIEVNNPTDSSVTCTVTRADGFTLIPAFSKTLTVRAGDTAMFEVDANVRVERR